jgi:hypothetical protein
VADIDGDMVAAISVVNQSNSFSFLGLYLCRPEYRGRGIGFALWSHALTHAGGRTVGLDGVADQEANYAKSGFKLTDRTRRLSGTLATEGKDLPLATPSDLPALMDLDRAANGVARDAFLSAWIESRPTRKTVVLREDDTITGFATARQCREGVKIGPVIAPDAGSALSLAKAAAAIFADPQVVIDVPDSCTEFGALLRQAGFTETFATARMYRGPAPTAGQPLHAVTTLELG